MRTELRVVELLAGPPLDERIRAVLGAQEEVDVCAELRPEPLHQRDVQAALDGLCRGDDRGKLALVPGENGFLALKCTLFNGIPLVNSKYT